MSEDDTHFSHEDQLKAGEGVRALPQPGRSTSETPHCSKCWRVNGGSGGKQVGQVVVATSGQSALSSDPEGALLEECESSRGFHSGKVTISSFVILHTRLGDERFSVC
ncbi:MAG TPA: hypothetical protein VKV40_01750 [Ktedonobacteraceae bacterium]|nr:hypothetical protein [Ktedonobacteraceae bacterium]